MSFYRNGPAGDSGPAEVVAATKQLDLLLDSTPSKDAHAQSEHDSGRLRGRDGRQLRDHGMAAARAAAWPGWKVLAEEGIRTLAASGRAFDAEDLRRLIGDPLGTSPNALGALLNAAMRRGQIAPAGYTTATRPEAHGRVLRLWRGVAS